MTSSRGHTLGLAKVFLVHILSIGNCIKTLLLTLDFQKSICSNFLHKESDLLLMSTQTPAFMSSDRLNIEQHKTEKYTIFSQQFWILKYFSREVYNSQRIFSVWKASKFARFLEFENSWHFFRFFIFNKIILGWNFLIHIIYFYNFFNFLCCLLLNQNLFCNRSILREKCTSFFTTSSMVLVFDSTKYISIKLVLNKIIHASLNRFHLGNCLILLYVNFFLKNTFFREIKLRVKCIRSKYFRNRNFFSFQYRLYVYM